MPDTSVENVDSSVRSAGSEEAGGEVTETSRTPAGDGSAQQAALPEVPPHLGRDLVLYTLVRFGLIAAVAVLLLLAKVPLLVGLAVGLVVGLVLSMLLLRGWHNRIAAGLAARGMVRRAARDRLRAELRGELRGDRDGGIEDGSQSAVESAVESGAGPEPLRDGDGDEKAANS